MKLLLYCNKAKPYLSLVGKYDNGKNYYEAINDATIFDDKLNGKIVAECDFEVSTHNWYKDYSLFEKLYYQENMTFNNENSCMSSRELVSYLGDNDLKKDFYAIHIKNLHIFDEPRDVNKLWQFKKYNTHIKNAPQNMMECYDIDGEYKILISIKPEWLCKILNGKKTIEVRKKVLKEML